MLDIFKRPVVVIIIVVAIVIALVWSYVSNSIKDKASVSQDPVTTQLLDLTTIDPTEYDDAIKREFAAAKSKAEASDINNKLSAIEITLPSLELNSGDTRYVFSSATNTQINWTITYNQKTGNMLRASIPKEDYLGNILAMDTSLWKFNYVTAIQIAEKNDGLKWREQNGLSNVDITLKHGGKDNWLLWTVRYTSGGATFTKMIDSNSGKVVAEN